jgi:UDP-2-acetamido-3-amino-2,3-dideoxy-glucuronate N-acetyltransferase
MEDYFVHNTATIDEGAKIGSKCKIWHYSHVMHTSVLGSSCILGQNVFIGPHVRIGDGVKIQNNVSIYEGVMCEDDVFIGPSVVFTNVINPRSFIERKDEYKETIVEKGATIGANATIICGNRIGRYAMIGAGSVVTKDVAPYVLVIGNPAINAGWVSEAGIRLEFNEEGVATCGLSGDTYILLDNVIEKQ